MTDFNANQNPYAPSRFERLLLGWAGVVALCALALALCALQASLPSEPPVDSEAPVLWVLLSD
jgi:hypothetical protein